MNKIIKDQISQLKPSATLVINEESNRLQKSGKKVYGDVFPTEERKKKKKK